MKIPVSSTSGFSNGTDIVSAAAVRNQKKAEANDRQLSSSPSSSAFLREIPIPREAAYVEADGKKYLLNAPRGTYLNIIV